MQKPIVDFKKQKMIYKYKLIILWKHHQLNNLMLQLKLINKTLMQKF